MELFEMNLTTQYPIKVITKKEVKEIIERNNKLRKKTIKEINEESEKMIQLENFKREQYLKNYYNKYGINK